MIGLNAIGKIAAPAFVRLEIQHAGPKLSGYATSAPTTTTVAQNATPGFLRSVIVFAVG